MNSDIEHWKFLDINHDDFTYSYTAPLHPGFFTRHVAGRFLVSAVVSGSPAEGAGVSPGDEILQIDGKRPGAIECGQGASSSMVLTLGKAGKEREAVESRLSAALEV